MTNNSLASRPRALLKDRSGLVLLAITPPTLCIIVADYFLGKVRTDKFGITDPLGEINVYIGYWRGGQASARNELVSFSAPRATGPPALC
jgi:hypothetical protein